MTQLLPEYSDGLQRELVGLDTSQHMPIDQNSCEDYVIGKRGQYTPVGAYLAGDEIIKIALQHGVQMIHPGMV